MRTEDRNVRAATISDLHLPTDQDSSGRILNEPELTNLSEVISSGVLNATKGKFVKQLQSDFAGLLGVHYAYATSSGTAAIHAAIAAIDPEPGDEIVTSPITDMGALSPILYQGAIPVFADVDPRTCNVTALTIEAALSERTRAIIVTHLFGNPCEMTNIMLLAESKGIPVIEDCAQAFLASHRGRCVGTIGKLGCFSLQQGKHITCGEGGLMVTDDPYLARRVHLFINKGWGYGDESPDHEFLALNYRMTELQGAVAAGQLPKLELSAARRIAMAHQLTERLADLGAVETPFVHSDSVHSYWKYCLRVNEQKVSGGCEALGNRLKDRGIFCAPRYIQKPAFDCKIFREQKTFGHSRFPFSLARPEALEYDERRFPGTYQALRDILVLPWNENYEERHVDFISNAIHDALVELTY
jgi:dTDP-4-amino-4,6-dideoxygalactose transaminase